MAEVTAVAKASEQAKTLVEEAAAAITLVPGLAGSGVAMKLEGLRVLSEFTEPLASGQRERADRAPKSPPLPRPCWRIQLPDGVESEYVLSNAVDRSIAKEVRLESDAFEFWDGAHWANISGKQTVQFAGRVAPDGYNHVPTNVGFTVSWYDESAQNQSTFIWLDTSDWTPF